MIIDKLFKDDWFERLQDDLEDMTIGEMLAWERFNLGLSLTDFQNLTGINRALCCKYENNKKKMSESHFEIIRGFLGGAYDEEITVYKERKTS